MLPNVCVFLWMSQLTSCDRVSPLVLHTDMMLFSQLLQCGQMSHFSLSDIATA